jgi:hypothetical protein
MGLLGWSFKLFENDRLLYGTEPGLKYQGYSCGRVVRYVGTRPNYQIYHYTP